MSSNNNKAIFKINSIFPYSTYLARSYSPTAKSLKDPQPEREQEEFNCFVQGWGLKDLAKELEMENRKMSFRLVRQEKVTEIAKINLVPCEKERKTLYRTRETKSLYKNTTNSPLKKQKITNNKGIQVFYRYQIISLLGLLNRRDDYISFLRGKNQDQFSDPLKPHEIQDRITKVLESKGKDKGRQKFNYLLNQQMKSLKYKARYANHNSNSPKKSRVQNNEEEEVMEEIEDHCDHQIDMQTWKRRNGVGFYQKVFIIKGGYAELRRTLLEKGWYENEDVWSPHFDFKWTTRICDINYLNLRHYQSVNHFNNNYHLTSKYGLTRRLRTLILSHNIDVDKFYPRCFDLGDQVDFENFIQNFKLSFAESVARRFLVDKKRYHKLELKIRLTVEILKRRIAPLASRIGSINRKEFPLIYPEEWEIITQTTDMSSEEKQTKLKEWRKKQPCYLKLDPSDENYENQLYGILDGKVKEYLNTLRKQDPQIQMNGFRNIWICKPNFMSRGRGIRCYNNIYDITDYCLGGTGQFVVQKYIEHPLVIEDKKFDIRQWVLIQDFSPAKIWFYNDCYIRFCADDFSLQNIYNRHIHLTNNSVQKFNKNGNIDKSMWTMDEFADYVGYENWAKIQQKMKNIVVWSIKSCEGYVLGRRGSCEFVGYDFMIDENLDPWLIEINMSPSMEHSTPITKKMVKRVLNDTGKIIGSNKKGRDTGAFSCIYEGNKDLQRYTTYKF